MAGISNKDRFIMFLGIFLLLWALSNVIYVDYFAEKEETITDKTIFTYFTADIVDNPELRPVDTFVRRPIQTVPNYAIHPDMIMVGSGFKVSQNVWFTARHVVDGCKKVFVNEDYDNEQDIGTLLNQVYIHPASDLAAFVYDNIAPSFTVPTLDDDESKKTLLRTTAYTAGYPVGIPGNLYVKYLGKAALHNKNFDLLEPVFVWTVSKKFPEDLTTVGGISGSPMFNAESRLVGVTIAEMVRRGTISVADLHSINWFVKAVEDLSTPSRQKVAEQFTPEKMTELSNGLRNNKSIVQLVCET